MPGLRAVPEVASVVQTHRHDLARLAGRQQLHIGELVGNARFGAGLKKIAFNLPDGGAIQDAIRNGGIGAVANVLGHVSILYRGPSWFGPLGYVPARVAAPF